MIIAGLAGGSDLGYVALKGRADRLQAALTADLEAGQRQLEAGKASLQSANSKHDANLATQAFAEFALAKEQFQAASALADTSTFLRYLEYAPAVGAIARSRHEAVDGIASMGSAISAAGEELSTLDTQLLNPPPSSAAARSLLTVLGQAQTSMVEIRSDLDLATKAAAKVDADVLPNNQRAAFLKARNAISSARSGVDEFERLVPLLEEVLGADRPRSYLIEQVNPAELRAGGGFIGTFSVMQADHGMLKVLRSGDSYELTDPRPDPGQPGFIAQPSPYREVIPQVSWSFVDSNLYPDFPSNAKAAETFVQPRVGQIDGVISMDYYVVAKVLELTGPIVVPGYAITVDSNTLIPELIKADVTDASHKAIASSIAGPLLGRVSALTPDQWPALIAALNDLATQHHIQAYFNSPMVESEIDRISWSGTLNPASSKDFLFEVESNYDGDKANYWLNRQYTVTLTRQDETLHHRVVVDLINRTPAGSFVRVDYKVNIRLYIWGDAKLTSDNLLPVRYPNPSPPSGFRLIDGWLPPLGCCGAQARAVFEYDTPWHTDRGGRHQIYWQKQPGTVDDKVDVIWNDGSGGTFSVSGSLNQDLEIDLVPRGVLLNWGASGQAALPNLSLG